MKINFEQCYREQADRDILLSKISSSNQEYLSYMGVGPGFSKKEIFDHMVLSMEEGELEKYITVSGEGWMSIWSRMGRFEVVTHAARGSKEWVLALVRFCIAEKENIEECLIKDWVQNGRVLEWRTRAVFVSTQGVYYTYTLGKHERYFSLALYGLDETIYNLVRIESENTERQVILEKTELLNLKSVNVDEVIEIQDICDQVSCDECIIENISIEYQEIIHCEWQVSLDDCLVLEHVPIEYLEIICSEWCHSIIVEPDDGPIYENEDTWDDFLIEGVELTYVECPTLLPNR